MRRRYRVGLGLALIAPAVLGGCGERETRTVDEVKADYAARFVRGIDFGLAGRIKAASFDPKTYVLSDVRIDGSPDQIYHADFAEMHVSAQDDTMVLEFITIVGADAAQGGLTETPMTSTAPIHLPFDVVPTDQRPKQEASVEPQ